MKIIVVINQAGKSLPAIAGSTLAAAAAFRAGVQVRVPAATAAGFAARLPAGAASTAAAAAGRTNKQAIYRVRGGQGDDCPNDNGIPHGRYSLCPATVGCSSDAARAFSKKLLHAVSVAGMAVTDTSMRVAATTVSLSRRPIATTVAVMPVGVVFGHIPRIRGALDGPGQIRTENQGTFPDLDAHTVPARAGLAEFDLRSGKNAHGIEAGPDGGRACEAGDT